MNKKISRTDKRRAETKKEILKISARHFSEKGINNSKLEDIAEEVDIARGTLYSHFPTKEHLVNEILKNLMEDAVIEMEKMDYQNSDQAIEQLLRVYLKLWQKHSYAWKIGFQLKEKDLGELAPYHYKIMESILKVFKLLNDDNRLMTGDPELSSYIFYVASMHLTEIYKNRSSNYEDLFISSIKGLLVKP